MIGLLAKASKQEPKNREQLETRRQQQRSGGFFKASRAGPSRSLIDESPEDLIQRHSAIRDASLEEVGTKNARTKWHEKGKRTKVSDVRQ